MLYTDFASSKIKLTSYPKLMLWLLCVTTHKNFFFCYNILYAIFCCLKLSGLLCKNKFLYSSLFPLGWMIFMFLKRIDRIYFPTPVLKGFIDKFIWIVFFYFCYGVYLNPDKKKLIFSVVRWKILPLFSYICERGKTNCKKVAKFAN